MTRRKELKFQYKLNPQPMGVYQIKNKQNGKVFVTSSMNLPGSFNGDRFKLNLKMHPNKALQNDWNNHGPDVFSFIVLETLDITKTPEADWQTKVTHLEQKWLANLQPFGERGYNRKET